MRIVSLLFLSLLLAGCQTTSNSSYTKLQNYLAEPSEMKLVVFAKSMWGAPDIFLSIVDTEKLYDNAQELLRQCNSLNVPKSYYTCKVTHIGNKRIAYKNDTQLQRLFHIQELKNNPEYKSKNTAKEINPDDLTSQDIETADTSDVTILGPLNAMQLVAAKSDDETSPFQKKRYTVIVVTRAKAFFADLREEYLIGTTDNSIHGLISSLLKKCKSGTHNKTCNVSHLGNKVITYRNERELEHMIELYKKRKTR